MAENDPRCKILISLLTIIFKNIALILKNFIALHCLTGIASGQGECLGPGNLSAPISSRLIR